jgi:hypothetical protein
MTDLQMGLIGFGGVAVLGVLAYNKWQERKHRRMAEELLGARQTDVLLDEAASAAGAAASKDGCASRHSRTCRTLAALRAGRVPGAG